MSWNMQDLRQRVLEDDLVQLRRIHVDDKAALSEIAYEPEIWTYFVSQINCEAALDDFIEQAIHDTLAGTRMVYVIVDKHSGRVAGSTAFGNLAPRELRLEIGWSWLGSAFRGTGHNRATKRLLLDHAFGPLECERVEFKTDVLNKPARRGLEGIGAQEEGIFRSFNFMPGGRRRDAVYYSILRREWPNVRATRFKA